MFPKPPRTEPKARKPLKRKTRVVTRRTKARKGRLRGKEIETLRYACFERDEYKCVRCGRPVRFERGHADSGEMAHIKAKRRHGDSLSNVRTLCGPFANGCHAKEHNFGPSGVKPCKKKEEAMATIHIQNMKDQDGVARPGEPYPRPYVTLIDGRTMTYKEWMDAKQPA